MAAPNFPNRTLAIMDNLEFLRATDNESVDLIAIDPPFGANETFEGAPRPPITDAERRAEFTLAASHGEAALERYRKEDKQLTRVKDDWFFRDIDPDWMKTLRDAGERVRVDLDAGDTPGNRDRTLDAMREVIEAVSACATENEAAYIAEMSVRLLECHRVLKPTGSIYLHCDDRANSYLRMLMDGIFGHENFVNEITWRRQTSNNSVKRKYGRIADTLLFYSKSGDYAWNQPYHERSEREMREYRKDEDGRLYKLDNLTTPTSNPARQFTWRGATPSASRSWKADAAGLEAMLARGEIELGRDGNAKLRGWKRYLDEMAEGQKAQSIWTDINRVGNTARERTGYSTQKPLALYRRIIRASSNPGDVVLDLFAGCATTVVAAELEGRNWLACDWAYRASTMMMRRFYQNGHQLEGMNVDVVRDAIGEHQIKFEHKGEDGGRVVGPPDLPDYPRQTEDPDDGALALKAPRRAPISTSWTGSIPKARAKELLLAEFGPRCWGCGMPATRPNGSVNQTLLQVDHIRARKVAEGEQGGRRAVQPRAALRLLQWPEGQPPDAGADAGWRWRVELAGMAERQERTHEQSINDALGEVLGEMRKSWTVGPERIGAPAWVRDALTSSCSTRLAGRSPLRRRPPTGTPMPSRAPSPAWGNSCGSDARALPPRQFAHRDLRVQRAPLRWGLQRAFAVGAARSRKARVRYASARMPPLSQVELRSHSLDRFRGIVAPDAFGRARATLARGRELLDGRAVWHVNSTAEGGGVAEMLRSLLAYARGEGIDARWAVIEGNPDFFRLTKRLHHALHGSAGDGSPLDDAAARVYRDTLAPNAEALLAEVRPGDAVFLHDPQTAGMAAALMAHGATVVWRCHIGTDDFTPEAERGWNFLAPYVREAPLRVFSRRAYVPPALDDDRSVVAHPSIDAFSAKNQELGEASVRAILTRAGLVAGPAGEGAPCFTRGDGSAGTVERCASVLREDGPPPWDAPLVVQVSRWDPLKDHGGVMRGFAAFAERPEAAGAHLVLAGPDVAGVGDDPEGGLVLEALKAEWRAFPRAVRARMHLASLPMDDVEENAAIVNALQRHARVVVQKSLREGFGLTLTEAMWKRRPVVASRVGGLQDQVVHGEEGLLLDDPTDADALADALGRVFGDEAFAAALGERAHARVRAEFLGIRHLARYQELLNGLLA